MFPGFSQPLWHPWRTPLPLQPFPTLSPCRNRACRFWKVLQNVKNIASMKFWRWSSCLPFLIADCKFAPINRGRFDAPKGMSFPDNYMCFRYFQVLYVVVSGSVTDFVEGLMNVWPPRNQQCYWVFAPLPPHLHRSNPPEPAKLEHGATHINH